MSFEVARVGSSVELLPPRDELVFPAGSNVTHDLDGNAAHVGVAGDANCGRIFRKRRNLTDARDFEVAHQSFAFAQDPDIRWCSDLDVAEYAANFDLGCAFAHACLREIQLRIAHAGEDAEDAWQDPFAVALEIGPPHSGAVAKRDNVIGEAADEKQRLAWPDRGRRHRCNTIVVSIG